MRVDVWRGRAQAEVGGLDGWQTCATSGRHVQHLHGLPGGQRVAGAVRNVGGAGGRRGKGTCTWTQAP